MINNSEMSKAKKPSPRMRSIFREVARDIVGRDRAARRLGLSQNTIGEIERAMAKAFIFGQEALIDPQQSLISNRSVDWLDVPPRSREILCSMTVGFSRRLEAIYNLKPNVTDAKADEIEMFDILGRTRWAFVHHDNLSDRTIANGSVVPLIRLGLLSPLTDKPMRYALTESGLDLCREYWRRSDADDPTLPRQSMR